MQSNVKHASQPDLPLPTTAGGRVSTQSARPGSRGFRIAIGLVLLFAGGYVANQRVGTTANVDNIVIHPGLVGGFVAIGQTPDQPGAIVLSHLNRSQVQIDAQVGSNWATGQVTHLRIATPMAFQNTRLRGPLVVTIDAQGRITTEPLTWSSQDFTSLNKALDCSIVDPDIWKPCGQPFGELQKWVAGRDTVQLPKFAQAFLASVQDDG